MVVRLLPTPKDTQTRGAQTRRVTSYLVVWGISALQAKVICAPPPHTLSRPLTVLRNRKKHYAGTVTFYMVVEYVDEVDIKTMSNMMWEND